jgi:hypothetical protein
MHLPTHGLLRRKCASALVVTPSCDLSNRKVNTITYLPIISFVDWVSCRDFLPEIVGALSSLVDQLNPVGIHNDSALTSTEIFSKELSEQLVSLGETLANKQMPKPLRSACERFISGGNHLRRVSRGEPAVIRDLETCLTKNRWKQIRNRMVRNSFRPDI